MITERGSALVVVLWCVVILSTVVFSTLDVTRLDLRVAKNYGDRVQARYLALAGVEFAKARIHAALEAGDRDALRELFDDANSFREVALGRGYASILRAPLSGESGEVIYGILDEERFLDLNSASLGQIQKLPDMLPELAAAIVDWRDADSIRSPGGAESDDYRDHRPPYEIRNGRLETLRELLAVRGMTPQFLLGEDHDGDGVLDWNERDGGQELPFDNGDAFLDRGLSAHVTVESAIQNVDAEGEARVHVQSASVEELSDVAGIDSSLAEAIVAYREFKKLEAVVDLLQVRELQETQPQNPPPDPGNRRNTDGSTANNNSSSNSSSSDNGNNGGRQPVGDPLIDIETFIEICDHCTVQLDLSRSGVVNINHCSVAVLRCLPGMNDDLARSIIEYRDGRNGFDSIGVLLEVDGMNQEILKQLEPSIDVRSSTFRIVSEGIVPSTGACQRVMVTVRFGSFDVETLSYREDL